MLQVGWALPTSLVTAVFGILRPNISTLCLADQRKLLFLPHNAQNLTDTF